MFEQARNEGGGEASWFLDLIEQSHADYRFGKRQPCFFWDTVDVTSALMGMSDLYQGTAFDQAEFNSNRTLVRCLAAAGWLGTIQLLPPHQEEFKNFLGRTLGSMSGSIPPGGAGQFLRDALGQQVPKIDLHSPEFSKQVREITLREAKNAEALFKAVQSIGHPQTRFSDWQRNGTLSLTIVKKFDYMKAIGRPEAEDILNYLASKRPNLKINNFTDTMALCYLDHLLKEAEADRKRASLPMLYVSSTTLLEAVACVKNPDFLKYVAEDGTRISVLREADYLIFQAVLKPYGSKVGASGASESANQSIDALRRGIGEHGAADDAFTELLNNLRIEGKPLGDAISSLRRLLFLDRVWLPFAATQLEETTLKYVATAQKLANSDAYKREFSHELTNTFRILESNVDAFAVARDLFVTMTRRAKDLDAPFLERAIESDNVENQYSLVRFGFSAEARKTLQEVLSRLASHDDKERNRQIILLISRWRPESLSVDEVAILCSVFWILRMHEELVDLSKQRRRLPQDPPIWMPVATACSLLELRRDDWAEFKGIVKELQAALSRFQPSTERGRLASALAYIHFHWWQNRGGDALWRTQSVKGLEPTTLAIFNSAIHYAVEGLRESEHDKSLHAYVLNQYVFYATEGGDDKLFDSLESYIDALIRLEPDPAIWQYRYDDTLARYFDRLAHRAPEPLKSDLLLEAFHHIDDARKACPFDKEVQAYAARLLRVRGAAAAKAV